MAKITGRAMSMPGGLAVGGGVSLGITLAGCSLLAWLVGSERIDWQTIGYWIMAMLLLGSFLGASVACARIKRQRLLVSILAGVVYMGILLSITALFFGGQYDGVMVTMILVLGSSLAAGLLGLRQEGKKPGSRKRRI